MKKLPKKAICKWNKATLEKALPILLQQADQAQYVCRKCGRIAADPKNLCKAMHRSDFDES